MTGKLKRAAAILIAAALTINMGTTVFAADDTNGDGNGQQTFTEPGATQGDDQKGGTKLLQQTSGVEDDTVLGQDNDGTYSDTESSANSLSTDDYIQETPMLSGGYVTDSNGTRTDLESDSVTEEIDTMLRDENSVKEILKDSGYQIKDDSKVVVIGAGDFSLSQPVEGLENGAETSIYLASKVGEYLSNPGAEGLKTGDRVYILHQKADGTWEVIEGTVEVRTNSIGSTTYLVKAVMNGFSPVAIIKVMSDGQVVVLDKNGETVSKVEVSEKTGVVSASEKKSPKTGQ